MRSCMELFEQIRRDRDREGLSTRALAVKHGVHRRAVRQALASPVPWVKRKLVSRPAPKLGEHRALIDAWLEADRAARQGARYGDGNVHLRLSRGQSPWPIEDMVAATRATFAIRDAVNGR